MHRYGDNLVLTRLAEEVVAALDAFGSSARSREQAA